MKKIIIFIIALMLLVTSINNVFACSVKYAKKFEGKNVTLYLNEDLHFVKINVQIIKVIDENYCYFRDLRTHAVYSIWLQFIDKIEEILY